MTQHPDLFAALAAPFEPNEVKVRAQAGRQLPYVTARTVMNRLDAVLGPENWWDEYLPNANSVLCRLTVRLPDGATLTKADAGGYAGMADSGDDDKSGYSDAFKRAAVKFGVARYLYRDGVPGFVRERVASRPTPAPAVAPTPPPAGAGAVATPPARREPRRSKLAPPRGVPASGRALYGWLRDQEQRHEVALLEPLDRWARDQGFPARMVAWDPSRTARAFSEAVRLLDRATAGAEAAG